MKTIILLVGCFLIVLFIGLILWKEFYISTATSLRINKESLTINVEKFVYIIPKNAIKSVSYRLSSDKWYIETEADSQIFCIKNEIFDKEEVVKWLNTL